MLTENLDLSHHQALQRLWLARGLGQPRQALSLLGAEILAPTNAGVPYWQVALGGIQVAVRQDGLRVCLRDLPEEDEIAEVSELLHRHGIQRVRIERGGGSTQSWVEVGLGQPPVPSRATALSLCLPGQPDKPLAVGDLRQHSAGMVQLLLPELINRLRLEQTHGLAALPGQVLGRFAAETPGEPGRDVFGRVLHPPVIAPGLQVLAGPGIAVASGEWRCDRYGYLGLAGDHLTVVPPVHVPPHRRQAFWVVLDRQAHEVRPEMIYQCLEDQGVVHGVIPKRIDQLAERIRAGTCKRGMYVIAKGTPPDPGDHAHLEIPGQPPRLSVAHSGGSLVVFCGAVKADQLVARRRPPRAGRPGCDVSGHPVPPPPVTDIPLTAGSGVRQETDGGIGRFFATTPGILKLANAELSVRATPLLAIDGDVGEQTGDLDFQGDVSIVGSVRRGFNLKATGDVLIGGEVEAGCVVATRGNIDIGGGVVGNGTRVLTQGSVRAHFVEDATVAAGRSIDVGWVRRGRLRCGNQVVVSGPGQGAGTVVGGQVWASHRIDLAIAGSAAGETTSLAVGTATSVGVTADLARNLDRIQAFLDQSDRQLAELRGNLGVDPGNPTQFSLLVQAVSVRQRRLLLSHKRQIDHLADLRRRAEEEREALERQVLKCGRLEVRVSNVIHPGVHIRLGCHQIGFDAPQPGGRFRLVGDNLRQEDC